MTEPRRVVLCEGYHDRAFWKGLLTHHFHCLEDRTDPTGRKLSPRYGFRSATGVFIEVGSCNGDLGVLQELGIRVDNREVDSIEQIVATLDADDVGATARFAQVHGCVRAKVPQAIISPDRPWEIVAGGTAVQTVVLRAVGDTADGWPREATLEQVVCAALASVHPARGEAVESWLATRPEATAPNNKNYAWSFMAGWAADDNCDEFYQALWRDAAVASALKATLQSIDAWDIAAAVAA